MTLVGVIGRPLKVSNRLIDRGINTLTFISHSLLRQTATCALFHGRHGSYHLHSLGAEKKDLFSYGMENHTWF